MQSWQPYHFGGEPGIGSMGRDGVGVKAGTSAELEPRRLSLDRVDTRLEFPREFLSR